MTPREWSKAFLATMGYPITDNNVASMIAWTASEGGHYFEPTNFNPLNTSQRMPGSHGDVGYVYGKPQTDGWRVPSHIQAYSSWDEGLEATKRTILSDNPAWHYAPIREALQASLSPEQTLDYVRHSSWGTVALKPDLWRTLQAYGEHPDPIGGSASIEPGPVVPQPVSSAKWLWLGGGIAGAFGLLKIFLRKHS